jgi:hypothetical protein
MPRRSTPGVSASPHIPAPASSAWSGAIRLEGSHRRWLPSSSNRWIRNGLTEEIIRGRFPTRTGYPSTLGGRPSGSCRGLADPHPSPALPAWCPGAVDVGRVYRPGVPMNYSRASALPLEGWIRLWSEGSNVLPQPGPASTLPHTLRAGDVQPWAPRLKHYW